MMMNIRMIDLAAQNREIKPEVDAELECIHARTSYIGGPQVEAFEREFAAAIGVTHVVGVGSGTDALRLSLMAMGVGEGCEVITVPMTFIATAEAIVQVGARPVFVDVDPATCNMSPQALRRYLAAGRWSTPGGPRAILPVHLYGMPAAMGEIMAIAREYGLPVLEDACQAHGARILMDDGWQRAGSIGVAGCFSFYPGKNLGAWGEAGAVATNDAQMAARVATLRDHGRTSHYGHSESGYNARLDTIQAAVLLAKLKHLDRWNARRRQLALTYRMLLRGTTCELQAEPDGVESCYHLFTIRNSRRERLRQGLQAAGIECGIHYPLPLHLQPALQYLGYRKGDFPISEAIADSVLSLPMHPHLSDAQAVEVVKTIGTLLRGEARPERAAMEDGQH
jgi:dTDP-4-amino-4,6-dideoxygalactose transaminase